MQVIKTKIPGLLILKPAVFKDERGYFFETFNQVKLRGSGIDLNFKQDNESKSGKHVLRGLHFQAPPFAQGKLVRVVKGAVLDVAVDLRPESQTYGQWESLELNEENKWMYWIPPGFAHGFLSLHEGTILVYKCTEVFNKESERSIIWNDPTLNISWGIHNPIVSERDRLAPTFNELKNPF